LQSRDEAGPLHVLYFQFHAQILGGHAGKLHVQAHGLALGVGGFEGRVLELHAHYQLLAVDYLGELALLGDIERRLGQGGLGA